MGRSGFGGAGEPDPEYPGKIVKAIKGVKYGLDTGH
jgi:hypothetical protein